MKRIIKKSLLAFIIMIFSLCASGKTFEIGVTQIIEHSVLDGVRDGFEEYLRENNFNCRIDFQSAQGDMITQQLIGNKFQRDKKDLILAISTPSVQAMQGTINGIPILFGAVSDYRGLGMENNKNITGISDSIPQSELFHQSKKYFPERKKVGIIYNISEKNSEFNVKRFIELSKDFEMEVITKGVTSLNDVPMALETILEKVDIIYMLPDNTVVSASNLIYTKAKEKKIPVLAIGYNKEQILMGGVLTVSADYKKIGYRLGEIAKEILEGKDIQKFSVEIPDFFPVLFNEEMMKFYNLEI